VNNLIRFLQKYHLTLLFILLESIALSFVVNGSKQKRVAFFTTANSLSGYVYEKFNFIDKYFGLETENQKLSEENAILKNMLRTSYSEKFVGTDEAKKKLLSRHYYYIPAKIVHNSVNLAYNFITIDKGRNQGIEPDMGVVTPDGSVVGIVKDVSANFSSVISLLNQRIGVSGKIKKNNYFGSVTWKNSDWTTVNLGEIPNHAEVRSGDTIVTSGYSTIFPEGLMIGKVYYYKQNSSGNFFDITVKISTNFKKIKYVHVIKNFLKDEQEKLEHEN